MLRKLKGLFQEGWLLQCTLLNQYDGVLNPQTLLSATEVLQVCLLVTAKIATDGRATPCTKRALDHPALASLFSQQRCTKHHGFVDVLLNHPGEQSEGVRLPRLSRTRDGSVRKECGRCDPLRSGLGSPSPTGHFWAVRRARVPLSCLICGS